MNKTKSIAGPITVSAVLAVLVFSVVLTALMSLFMNILTDRILLKVLQITAKTAARDVQGNLHTLADRFFLLQSNILSNPASAVTDKQSELTSLTSGIEFVWLGLYKNSGELLAGSEDSPPAISGNEIIAEMEKTKNLVIEDTSAGPHGLEIVMGIPILDESDRSIACYLVGSYRYDILSDVLANINIGGGGAFIIGPEGNIIAHWDLDRVYGREHITESLGNGRAVTGELALMTDGQTGSAILNSSRNRIFLSYAPIRGTRWSLGIQAPRSTFIEPLRDAIIVCTFLTAVFLFGFAVIFAAAMKTMLTKPLSAITDNANKLAAGIFSDELPRRIVDRNDEIGRLGESYRSVSKAISRVIGDIGQLTKSAREGFLNKRADMANHKGDYHLIIDGINAMMDVFCSHFNVMPAALALFNAEAAPLYINGEMAEILRRHNFDSADPRLLSTLLEKPDWHALFDPREGLGFFYDELSFPGPDGTPRNYTVSLQRILDEKSVIMIVQDITQLIRARIDAEAASTAKSNFLANMSHEMRTPMNAIIGMTTLAQASSDPERKDYCLGKIESASNHLLGVINDVLDMSKIEANKLEISAQEFSFEKMLQKITNVMTSRIEEKHQTFIVKLDNAMPCNVISDEQRLSQVITNLLSNAVKFTPDGGTIKLLVKILEEKDNSIITEVEVNDTGIGISEAQQAKLFTSFQQADSSISRRFGGTGLGLAISKRIVEMMDGSFSVRSAAGKGSSFSFTVKLKRGGEEGASLLPGLKRQKLRILAVDDDGDVLEFFREIMRRYNLSCDTSPDGNTALSMVEEKGPYDIYFIDWKMPGIDGIELSRLLKESAKSREQTPPSVIVMMSAAEWTETEEDAKKAGIAKFLPKPLFASSIVNLINDCLGPAPKEETTSFIEPGCFKGHTILLAEDIEINREIVIALLESTGVAIDCAENGLAAFRLYSENPEKYSMIFMDVHMPEMDGYEATRRIRAFEKGKNPLETRGIPIVAMTANVFRQDIERCLASGMNGHVGKPLDFNEVMEKLKAYL
ncbi:MAG: response regulator [Treponema sp.]|jgi:signal transduction histidine kinase/CheY-like chemotaxis protein/HAMP domain-containing protein|nr:response regulator [Treponema sp.]